MKILDKFVLRTPTFSKEFLEDLTANKIEQLLEDKFFQKAILLASPSLYDAIQRYKEGKLNSKKAKNLFNSLACYVIRMSSRTSPFGLFSSCILGNKSQNSDISLDRSSINYVVRPDCVLQNQLVQKFLEDNTNISGILYFPNSTIKWDKNKCKCLELNDSINVYGYKVSLIESDEFLRKIISVCKQGKSFKEIVNYVTNCGYDLEDAKEYVLTLIEYQIFVSELEHIIVEDNTFNKLCNSLQNESQNTSAKIEDICNSLTNLNKETDRTVEIINQLKTKGKEIEISRSNPVYTQIIDHNSFANLDSGIYNELLDGILFLMNFLPKNENTVLDEFKKKFYNRYQDKTVPLEEVFDPTTGIGYPDDSFFKKDCPLLNNISFSNRGIPNNSFTETDKKLIGKLQSYYEGNQNEIRLSKSDLTPGSAKGQYSASFFALTEIVNIDSKPHIFLKSVAGSSAACLLSRFGVEDEEIQNYIDEIIKIEDSILNDNQAFAEVLSTPPPFTAGNVISRKHLREHEILYLANSNKDWEKKIFMSDLSICLKKNRFYLYADNLKKEIIPRLTTAYNFSLSSLPVFRFLSDLQFDGLNVTLNLRLGNCFSMLTHFPRIVYKNCILSLASWRLDLKEIIRIHNLGDSENYIQEIELWRIKNRLPKTVCLMDGQSNDLVINWKNYTSVGVLISQNKEKPKVGVQEFLFDRGKSPVLDKENREYTNEFIFSIINKDD